MNTSNHFFKTAQVCENGHLRNSDTSTHSAKNEDFCSICGAKVISACPHCGSQLRGAYYMNKPIYSGTMCNVLEGRKLSSHISGYKDVKISNTVDVPAYCHNCGKPYPWTEATLQTAEHIIDMLDELTPDQKKQLVDFIPDIIVETPQSRYAALVYAKFLDGLQGLAVDCFKDWLKKNVFPTLLVLLNMQKQ